MTTLDATPFDEMIEASDGDPFSIILEAISDSMAELQSLHQQGDYLKAAEVFDVMLDLRNIVTTVKEENAS